MPGHFLSASEIKRSYLHDQVKAALNHPYPMNPPRRRHRRRKRQNTVPGLSPDSEPSPHPVQVEQKYCEAVLDDDDDECFHQPLCLELLPVDGPHQ